VALLYDRAYCGPCDALYCLFMVKRGATSIDDEQGTNGEIRLYRF
jgi:hypothetical protein